MISSLVKDEKLFFELRRIFYRLYYSQEPASSPCTFMFTSAVQGEGKTVLSVSFAVAIVKETRHKCLLVDTNWARPAVHDWVGLGCEKGIEDILRNPLECVQESRLENLHVLAAPQHVEGAENVYLSAEILSEMVESLGREYKMIVFDSSSVHSGRGFVDPVLLGRFVNHILLVIMARRTKKQDVKKATFALERSREKVGAVLNNHVNPYYV